MVFDAVPVVSSAVPDGDSGNKAPEWPDESWERPDTKTPAVTLPQTYWNRWKLPLPPGGGGGGGGHN